MPMLDTLSRDVHAHLEVATRALRDLQPTRGSHRDQPPEPRVTRTTPTAIDGILIQWGDRLFYPGNRVVQDRTPRLRGLPPNARNRADAIRRRIADTVVRRAPQVMVKVTGGGRGMNAITAHLRYISKNGRLEIEDDRGQKTQGKGAVPALVDDWRYGGSFIDDESPRREAFNIMLSMPRGTDPQIVLKAAREFAQDQLADHKYVLVLHDHQANPHVHLSVRAESRHGRRLNPRKADLHRWREVFAEKLRGWGIDAEATRQATRGATRTRRNLFRMRQFYEAYQPSEFVPPLVAQIPWSHHLIILEQAKRPVHRRGARSRVALHRANSRGARSRLQHRRRTTARCVHRERQAGLVDDDRVGASGVIAARGAVRVSAELDLDSGGQGVSAGPLRFFSMRGAARPCARGASMSAPA